MIKNGKLFGKINIIDFLVVLVVIVAIAAVVAFVLKPKDGQDTLVMKFRIEELDEFVAEKVYVDKENPLSLYDDTYSIDLGEVIDVEQSDSITYGGVTDGVYSVGTKEGYKSMIITGKCTGTKTDLGAEIGGKKYGVGHSFVLRAGDAKLYLRVYDIMTEEEYNKQKAEEEKTAQAEKAAMTDVSVVLYTPEIETYIAESIKEGNKAANSDKNYNLGTVSAVKVEESKSQFETDDGFIFVPKEGYSSLTVECTAKGLITDDGVEIEGKTFSMGDTFMLRAGSTKVYVKVKSVSGNSEN